MYVPPGPHRTETERPGVGSLRKALRNLDPASDLSATVSELRNLDTRLGYIDTLPRVLYGTARSASAGTLARGTAGGGGGSLGTTSLVMGSSGRLVLDDYGSPELSKTQRRFASSLRGVDADKIRHKARWGGEGGGGNCKVTTMGQAGEAVGRGGNVTWCSGI